MVYIWIMFVLTYESFYCFFGWPMCRSHPVTTTTAQGAWEGLHISEKSTMLPSTGEAHAAAHAATPLGSPIARPLSSRCACTQVLHPRFLYLTCTHTHTVLIPLFCLCIQQTNEVVDALRASCRVHLLVVLMWGFQCLPHSMCMYLSRSQSPFCY